MGSKWRAGATLEIWSTLTVDESCSHLIIDQAARRGGKLNMGLRRILVMMAFLLVCSLVAGALAQDDQPEPTPAPTMSREEFVTRKFQDLNDTCPKRKIKVRGKMKTFDGTAVYQQVCWKNVTRDANNKVLAKGDQCAPVTFVRCN